VLQAAAPVTPEHGATGGESPSRPPVLISWHVGASHVLDEEHALTAKLDNWRDEPAEVTLELTGVGLDQRVSTVKGATVTLAPGEKRDVVVPLQRLPIQSVGAPAQIDLSGTCSLADGRQIRLPAVALHVQFDNGYERAYASTDGGWDVMALAYVGGDVSREEYAQMTAAELSTDAGSVLSVSTPAGGIDKAKARALYDKLVEPALHPSGRYVGDGGELSELKDPGSGGVPVQLRSDQMAALSEIMEHGAPDESKAAEGPTDEPGTKGPLAWGRYLTMCAKWGVQFNDSGLGEDYLNGTGFQQAPARYADAQIRKIGGIDYWIGNLDVNGCAPNTFLPYGDYYLRVRPDFDTTNNTRFYETRTNPSTFDTFWLPFSVVIGLMNTTVTTGDHPASRIGAVVSQLLITSETGIGLTADHEYRLVYDTGNCGGTGAYSQGDYICYGYDPNGGPHTTASKITIAHEIGHSVDKAGSGLGQTNYNWSTDIPHCSCDHVQYANQLHCIQSIEHTGTAFIEGFAQFFAANAFNTRYQSDCTFAYYKEFLDDNNNVWSPPVAMSCRDAHRWMKNHCDFPDDGGGVEMDWMTFLWSVHAWAESGSDKIGATDYHMIKRTACTGGTSGFCDWTDEPEFDDLRSAADGYFGSSTDPRAENFESKGFAHGVNRYN